MTAAGQPYVEAIRDGQPITKVARPWEARQHPVPLEPAGRPRAQVAQPDQVREHVRLLSQGALKRSQTPAGVPEDWKPEPLQPGEVILAGSTCLLGCVD